MNFLFSDDHRRNLLDGDWCGAKALLEIEGVCNIHRLLLKRSKIITKKQPEAVRKVGFLPSYCRSHDWSVLAVRSIIEVIGLVVFYLEFAFACVACPDLAKQIQK